MKDKGAGIAKPKRKKKIWIIILLVVAVLAVVIWNRLHSAPTQAGAENSVVEVEPVQKRDLSDTISLKGTIAGVSRTNVTSRAVAEITSLNVQLGDTVKEGDLLCTLDSASIREKISDLESSIAKTQAVENISNRQAMEAVQRAKEDQTNQLEEAQRQIMLAEESFNVAQMNYDNGDVDFPTLLSAQRAVEAAKESYEATVQSTNRAIRDAQLAAEQNRYNVSDSASRDTLNDLKEQLADCEIKAPCSGVVTAVNVSVGDVNAEKVTILTIEDTSALKLVTSVAEADILKIEEGMKAVVTADAAGEEEIAGTVSRVVRVKNQGTGDQAAAAGGYSVEVSINNKTLLVGMEAKVKIMIKEKGEVLAIPYDLVMYDENGDAYVLVAEPKEDGSATAVRRNVVLGEEVDYYTEVTGGDLAEGDRMIYDYMHTVVEGQTLSPEQMFSNEGMGGGAEGGADMSGSAEGAE